MAREYRVISADSHLEVPVWKWTDRIPSKYRDRAPRRLLLPEGGDAVIGEGGVHPVGLALCAGKPYGDFQWIGVTAEEQHGTGDPESRLREQDQDGIDAEALFPGGGSQGIRSVKDPEAFLAMNRAYNDFLSDYCSPAPDRLLGLAQIPDTGIEDAIEEMERVRKMPGIAGVVLNKYPAGKDVTSPEDDRFWAASLELDMPVTIHVQIGSHQYYKDGLMGQYPKKPGPMALNPHVTDFIKRCARYAISGGYNSTQMVLSGVFDRFPNLRVFMAETQIGWIPNYYDQFDDLYARLHHVGEQELGLAPLSRKPSEYLRDHFLWGFMRNPVGVRMRHEIGVENIMWSSDFPHSECDWPHSIDVIEEAMVGVPDDERYKIVAGNAVDFFRLEDVKSG